MLKEHTISEYIPVRDQVADILRKMITSGQIGAGQPLIERAISEQLQISTTPIKEALRILQSEGLIYTVPRKGSYVSDFAKNKMKQITHARSVMEGTAAYFAVENVTDEMIQELNMILLKSKYLTEKGEIQELAKNNELFHDIIRKGCKNDYILRIIKNLSSIDKTIRDLSLSKDAEEPKRAYKDHLSIFEAIKERNPKLAEKRLVEHIQRVADFVLNS